ncbi:multiple sugar transport system substrate-binding protein [Celeribacter marinus]|uniref:N-Acetyl-D-glucosamine ABC transport system, sugar-binding protein n=3 Tax=Celeribacter marinus TaxID=1397108 RepID=A0A0N7HIV3_9RHOB|nr:N-Acetyl-D-glucosamine ABC transport system, sugar-binding protein [Celeribacter marinus]SFK83852.1 multiple sugar transport system substrate-binding protein [Celeribacter marinus]
MFGLPFDNWTMLFHVNTNLMAEADMMNADGTPMLPSSVDEFFEMGAKFKAATGKPFLVQILANETSAYTRMLYTLLQQQNSDFFSDPSAIKLETPEAKAAVEFMKRIVDEGLTTVNLDYPAAVSGFTDGEGAIAVNGTWLIGAFEDQAQQDGNALSGGGYTVYPVPQFFGGKDSTYADGHGWVVPKNPNRDDETTDAIGKLFKYLSDNDFQWARTGHLPAVSAVFDMAEFKALPHRDNIAEIADTGESLPAEVQRQFAIQDIIGEEVGSAITGNKSVDDALSTAQARINDLLANL